MEKEKREDEATDSSLSQEEGEGLDPRRGELVIVEPPPLPASFSNPEEHSEPTAPESAPRACEVEVDPVTKKPVQRGARSQMGSHRAKSGNLATLIPGGGLDMVKRAKTLRENKEHRDELALAFLQTGSVTGAVRAVWPGLTERQVASKSGNIARRDWFQAALRRQVEVHGKTAEVNPLWCLSLWRDIAMHAKLSRDRLRATELIAKHLGMFIERKEIRSVHVDLTKMPKEKLLEMMRKKLGV